MDKIILTTILAEGNKLKQSLSLLDESFALVKCCNYTTIKENPEAYLKIKYIFSTWDMPVFSNAEVKKYFPSLVSIFYAAGTVKYFAKPFLDSGVKIFSAAVANAIPVAEFVTAQIVLANKGYFQAQKAYKKPFWRLSFAIARGYTNTKKGNYNAKIGLIGCGVVGSKIVQLLKSYSVKVFVYDPFLNQDRILDLGVEHIELVDLFSNCDVISNHLPNIKDTKGLINKDLLSLMKENVTFINTGRGEQVIESDLVRIMRRKPNACALLDVTLKEPVRPWSSILRRKNIFVTPHIAGSLSCEVDRLISFMFTAYINTINGRYDSSEVTINQLDKQT